jgi:hypothetical protein
MTRYEPGRDRAARQTLQIAERTKRQLAARQWTHLRQYTDAKAEVIETITRYPAIMNSRTGRGRLTMRASPTKPWKIWLMTPPYS